MCDSTNSVQHEYDSTRCIGRTEESSQLRGGSDKAIRKLNGVRPTSCTLRLRSVKPLFLQYNTVACLEGSRQRKNIMNVQYRAGQHDDAIGESRVTKVRGCHNCQAPRAEEDLKSEFRRTISTPLRRVLPSWLISFSCLVLARLFSPSDPDIGWRYGIVIQGQHMNLELSDAITVCRLTCWRMEDGI